MNWSTVAICVVSAIAGALMFYLYLRFYTFRGTPLWVIVSNTNFESKEAAKVSRVNAALANPDDTLLNPKWWPAQTYGLTSDQLARLREARAHAWYARLRTELLSLNQRRLELPDNASLKEQFEVHLAMMECWSQSRMGYEPQDANTAYPPKAAELGITPGELLARLNRLLKEYTAWLLEDDLPENYEALRELLVDRGNVLRSIGGIDAPREVRFWEYVSRHISGRNPTLEEFALSFGATVPAHNRADLRRLMVSAITRGSRLDAKLALAYFNSTLDYHYYSYEDLGGEAGLKLLETVALTGEAPSAELALGFVLARA